MIEGSDGYAYLRGHSRAGLAGLAGRMRPAGRQLDNADLPGSNQLLLLLLATNENFPSILCGDVNDVIYYRYVNALQELNICLLY